MMEVERWRSSRKSPRHFASPAVVDFDGSAAVKALEGSQKRLAILGLAGSGIVDEEKVVGLPVQGGALLWR